MGGRWSPRGAVRLVRRGIALALVLVAVWIISLTENFPGFSTILDNLGENSAFVVGMLSTQLSYSGEQDAVTASLDGWGRFLLGQSALLSGSAAAVEQELQAREDLPEQSLNQEEGDMDDQQESPLSPLPSGDVVEHTAVGTDDGSYLSSQEVYIKNATSQSVDVAALAAQPVELELGEGPQILIYHTHGSEAYTQTEQQRYVESDAYRTTDCTHNVVQVGEAMAEIFRSQGFEVVHDTTLYDYPTYNGAYERSRAGVEKWLEQYPTIKFVLDVHRDAIVSNDGAAYKLIAQEREEKVAQVMLVVGSSDSGAEHPNWRGNLALAVKLQLALARDYSQLARPITLRSTRFNQDLSVGALLVEVGGHGNTLEEALAGARLFARTTGETLKELGT